MGIATILKFIFSKAGVYVAVALAIVAGGLFIKHKFATYQSTIIAQNTAIATLKTNQETLKSANKTLNSTIVGQRRAIDNYDTAMNSSRVANNEIRKNLHLAKSKLRARDLGRLRASSHSELVLKIINKSTDKQIREWNQ